MYGMRRARELGSLSEDLQVVYCSGYFFTEPHFVDMDVNAWLKGCRRNRNHA